MIDANDAMTIDWMNPTAHMLAGRDAGKEESEDRICELEQEITQLRARIAELEATAARYQRVVTAAKELMLAWPDEDNEEGANIPPTMIRELSEALLDTPEAAEAAKGRE